MSWGQRPPQGRGSGSRPRANLRGKTPNETDACSFLQNAQWIRTHPAQARRQKSAFLSRTIFPSLTRQQASTLSLRRYTKLFSIRFSAGRHSGRERRPLPGSYLGETFPSVSPASCGNACPGPCGGGDLFGKNTLFLLRTSSTCCPLLPTYFLWGQDFPEGYGPHNDHTQGRVPPASCYSPTDLPMPRPATP